MVALLALACQPDPVGDLHGAALDRAVAELDYETSMPWLPGSEDNFSAMSGRPTLVWMSADYDLTAKGVERNVFENAGVRHAFAAHHIVPMRFDVTSPHSRDWMRRQRIPQEPWIVFYAGDAARTPTVISYASTPDELILRLDAALAASRTRSP